jgi:hypothetical protein
MCFRKISDGKFNLVQVAKKDIKCYKMLKTSPYSELIESPFMNTVYFTSNTKEPVTKETKFDDCHEDIIAINHGLHTYSSLRHGKKYLKYGNHRKMYKAYIPAGTQYYYNPNNSEYISEKLVVYPDYL